MKIYATDCYGCEACRQICPKRAITMLPGADGALLPTVDETLCVKCGLCRQVCPNRRSTEGNTPLACYAASCTDEALREKAASGGAFSALAHRVLARGGVVFGSAMPESGGFLPEHIMVDEPENLHRLQGSKYVQSRIGDAYKEVRGQLKQGRTVLFCGTPCQVDGLYGYLGSDTFENLYTADLVCHGVPSGKIFEDALHTLENENRRVTAFSFRDNGAGWGNFRYKLTYQDKKGRERTIVRPADRFSYYWLFLKGAIYRENCYRCPYASLHRVADITLGDWWGIEEEYPSYIGTGEGQIPEGCGVSCVLVNSLQGQKLMGEFGDLLQCLPTRAESAARHNLQLQRPQAAPEFREEVMALYRQKGYTAVERWYRKRVGVKFLLRKIKDALLSD